MNCDEIKTLLMGYLDGELDPEQRAQVDHHLASCDACRRDLAEFQNLNEELATMEFKDPSDEQLEHYWRSVYNRLERGLAWILFSLGAIILLCYGGFRLVESVVADPSVALVLKIGVLALVFGAVVLFVSLLRERLTVRRVDRYSKEIKK